MMAKKDTAALAPIKFGKVATSLLAQSDLSVVVVGASILDACLERLLAARMPQLSSANYATIFGDGPLGTFSAKIELAFALNLIGMRAFRELTLIRRIRNEAAHSVGEDNWSFAAAGTADRCRELTLIDDMASWVPPGFAVTDGETPRGRFFLTVFLIASQLEGESIANSPAPYAPMFLKL
jgi:hypothetical protein